MTYQPFIDDPAHIGSLDRQRFVVLRPGPPVSDTHRRVQGVLRQRLPACPVSSPACAHVTLAGFDAGTRLDAVQKLVASWARGVSALRIEAERITCFPAPFQVVVVQVRKTAELLAALVDLRQRAEEQRLAIATSIPAQDWVFHMSVAYCSGLGEPAWRELTEFVQTLAVRPGHAVVGEAEVVAFDEGLEYSGGVYALQGK